VDRELIALYFTDFVVRNKRTLNTLCLFYDRLFIHDYFGLLMCVDNKEEYDRLQGCSDWGMDLLWGIARGLSQEQITLFRSASENEFDALVLKGVGQGLGCATGTFSPTFVLRFAKQYAAFLRDTHALFLENALAFCQTLQNPHLPAVRLEDGVKLDLSCSDDENRKSLEQARRNNVRACLFEQDYHRIPLVSDAEQDLVPWDRSRDLLTAALATTSIAARVPTLADVPAEELLEVRLKLKDELPPFRAAVTKAAWEIAAASRESSMAEVMRLAQLYYETQVEPSINDVERKLASENARMRRKFLERSVDGTVLVAKALDPTEPYSKWELIGSGLKSLLDLDEGLQNKAQIRSAYEYLVKLPSVLRTHNV